MFQIIIYFAILKNTKDRTKPSEFHCTLSLKQLSTFFCGFTMYFLHILWKQNGRQNFLTFCGFRMSGKRIFHIYHCLSNIQHSPWLLSCVCVSQQPAQSIKIHEKTTRSQGFTPTMGGTFSVSQVWASAATHVPNGEKDISLRAIAQNPAKRDTRKRIGRCLQG